MGSFLSVETHSIDDLNYFEKKKRNGYIVFYFRIAPPSSVKFRIVPPTTGKQKKRVASRFAFAFYYFVLDFFLFCIAISSFFYETHLTFLEENK